MIDVGGPAMLRAAAKSYAVGLAVCRPQDYDAVLAELRAERARHARADARAAGRRRVRDDGRVRRGDRALVPATSDDIPGDVRASRSTSVLQLAYGENPHQQAAVLRRARRAHAPALVRRAAPGEAALVQQPERPLGGAAAPRGELDRPACVIVKHANPVRRRASPRRSRRRTRRRSPPIPCRRTAASSS